MSATDARPLSRLRPARWWRRRAARAVASGDWTDAKRCAAAADAGEFRYRLKKTKTQRKEHEA